MKYSQKLKEIIKAKCITQESLARDLGVTFASLNRWINEVSVPRVSNTKKIDEVYNRLFKIEENIKEFEKVKEEIFSVCKKINIKDILSRNDFVESLNTKMTYSTNKLEGSTLTEQEVRDVLYEGLSFSHRSLVEHIEAKNHESAMMFVLDNYKNKITDEYIKRLHSIMMNSIKSDAGNYRSHNVRIAGSFVPTANYLSIDKKMKAFCAEVNQKPKDIFNFLAKMHADFETIHPFSDGNGRVGRLLLMHTALQNNILPLIVMAEYRKKYLASLQKAQLDNIYQDLESVMVEAVKVSVEMI